MDKSHICHWEYHNKSLTPLPIQPEKWHILQLSIKINHISFHKLLGQATYPPKSDHHGNSNTLPWITHIFIYGNIKINHIVLNSNCMDMSHILQLEQWNTLRARVCDPQSHMTSPRIHFDILDAILQFFSIIFFIRQLYQSQHICHSFLKYS